MLGMGKLSVTPLAIFGNLKFNRCYADRSDIEPVHTIVLNIVILHISNEKWLYLFTLLLPTFP